METRLLSRLNRYLFLCYVISVLLVTLSVCGCAVPGRKMYPGEEVSPDKRAVIRVEQQSSGKMSIGLVDKKLARGFFSIFDQFPEEVYVLPGKHNIIVGVRFMFTHAGADLWVVAEPNETYVVKFLPIGDRVRIWIENERTGKPVGGITGSSDEPK